MSDIVVLSDDDDDCVIMSEDVHSTLYHEVYKENQLLAKFIEKCLCLEKSKNMETLLNRYVLEKYNKIEKSSRESLKIQKALKRANNLLDVEPKLKYSHIKDLCAILDMFTAKKKVPFVTLSTEVKDKNSEINRLKRLHTNTYTNSSKKAKLGTDDISSPFSETEASNILDEQATFLDESTIQDYNLESSDIEENGLLIPKEGVQMISNEDIDEKIKNIERKITCYKKQIEKLDEMEVDDDTVNSPYIKSERLKSSIVLLYKELCDLTGSQPIKRKEVRLQVVDGHPPGPTKALEAFLNSNIDSNGDLSFPDFYDVVTCVTEANDKDNLGWSKGQILKEASLLFTICGRALQKRRQKREYRDLLYKVKLESIEKDPADDDPELLKRLEENKKISVKKESDILERYVMMQNMPPKPKLLQGQCNSDIQNEIENHDELINNNNLMENSTSKPSIGTDNCEESATQKLIVGDKNIVNSTSETNADHQGGVQEILANVGKIDKTDTYPDRDCNGSKNKDCDKSVCVVNGNNGKVSDNSIITAKSPSIDEDCKQVYNKKIICSNNKINSSLNDQNSCFIQNSANENHDSKEIKIRDTSNVTHDCSAKSNANYNRGSEQIDSKAKNNILNDACITSIKQEPQDVVSLFDKLDNDFSVSLEIMKDPFVLIEILDSSDEEFNE